MQRQAPRRPPSPPPQFRGAARPSRAAQAVLNVGKDYFDKDSSDGIEAAASKFIGKKLLPDKTRIVANLTTMANSTTKEWDFKNWPQAVVAANVPSTQLPPPNRDFGEKEIVTVSVDDDEDDQPDSDKKWKQLFHELTEKAKPGYLEQIRQQFEEFESKSTTGANDAHASLQHSASLSATALAMGDAIAELKQMHCPEKVLKIFRKTKQNTEKGAKWGGETHHK